MNLKLIDIEGREIKTGNLILISSGGRLIKTYLLGITIKGAYISCHKSTNYVTDRDIEHHNNKRYLPYVQWRDLYLLDDSSIIPDKLLPFCKTSQLRR